MLKITIPFFDQMFQQNMKKMQSYAKFKQRRAEPAELINNFYLYFREKIEAGQYKDLENTEAFNRVFFHLFLMRLKHHALPNVALNGKQSFRSTKHSFNESSFGGEIGIEDVAVKHQQLADTPESLLIAKQNAYILNEALYITNIDAPKGTKLAIDWANEELPSGSMYNHGVKSHYTNSKKRLAQLIRRDEIDFSVYEEDKYTLYGAHAKGVNFVRKKCTAPGCTNFHKAKGLCSHHYQQKAKNEQARNTIPSNP